MKRSEDRRVGLGLHRSCERVSTTKGVASTVFIRAIEPLVGIERMRQRRSFKQRVPELRDLMRGPARLCEALAIDRTLDG